MQANATRFLMLIVAIVWLVVAHTPVRAEGAQTNGTQDYWLGVYLNGIKIGSVHVKVEPAVLDDKDAIRRERNWRVQAQSAGRRMVCDTTDVVYVTPAMKPLLVKVDAVRYMPGGTKESCSMTAHFDDNKCVVVAEDWTGGSKLSHTKTLDEVELKQMAAGFAYDMGAEMPSPSARVYMNRFWMEVYAFLPRLGVWFGFNDTTVVLVGPQQIELGKNTYSTAVVVEEEKNSDDEAAKILRRWLLKDGGIVKEEWQPSGITLIRECKEEATSSNDMYPEICPKPVEEEQSTTGEGES